MCKTASGRSWLDTVDKGCAGRVMEVRHDIEQVKLDDEQVRQVCMQKSLRSKQVRLDDEKVRQVSM